MTTLVKEILKKSPLFSAFNICSVWEEALGEEICRHARPVKLQHGVLTAVTASAAWATQLRFFSTEIKQKINALLAGEEVREVRFSVDLEEKDFGRGGERAKETERARNDPKDETLGEKLERLFSRNKGKRAERTAGQYCPLCEAELSKKGICGRCEGRARENREEALMLLLRKTPWLSYPAAAKEVVGLAEAGFKKIQRRMRTDFYDELWRGARELSKGENKNRARIRNRLYDYVMIKTGRSPQELDLALVRKSVPAKLWQAIAEEKGRQNA